MAFNMSNLTEWNWSSILDRRDVDIGIDHLIISSSQITRCFAIGLTSCEEVQNQLGRWIMPSHSVEAAKLNFDSSKFELRPGAPFNAWATRLTSSIEERLEVGLTVDVTGVFGEVLPWKSDAVLLSKLEWSFHISSIWEDVVRRFTWNEEFQRTRRSVQREIHAAIHEGALSSDLGPVALAMRLCTCEYTEIGTDVLSPSTLSAAAPYHTPSSSTFCNPKVEDAIHALRNRL